MLQAQTKILKIVLDAVNILVAAVNEIFLYIVKGDLL